jgi:hypothetical protein
LYASVVVTGYLPHRSITAAMKPSLPGGLGVSAHSTQALPRAVAWPYLGAVFAMLLTQILNVLDNVVAKLLLAANDKADH